jgi:hypothetical protein
VRGYSQEAGGKREGVIFWQQRQRAIPIPELWFNKVFGQTTAAWRVSSRSIDSLPPNQCEKRHFLRHLYIKTIILPRQARDEHRENRERSGVFHSLSPNQKKTRNIRPDIGEITGVPLAVAAACDPVPTPFNIGV